MSLNKFSMQRFMIYAVILVVIIFMLFNYNDINVFLKRVFGILTPFLFGAVVAFILNVPLRFLERRLFIHIEHPFFKRFERAVSIVLSILLVSFVLYMVGRLVVPQLLDSITLVFINADSYFKDFLALLRMLPDQTGRINEIVRDLNALSLSDLQSQLFEFLFLGADRNSTIMDTLTSTFGVMTSLMGYLIHILVGIFFAFYVLASKEKLVIQGRKIIFAFFTPNTARYVLHVFQLAFKKFHGFITGQLTEACIIGVLVYIGMLIMQMPLAGMVSVLIGFTALIPIAGAFIGGIVGALLIAPFNPIKAIVFVVFLVILQQFEGNVIYPRVVGGSVNLPAMWTLFAITVGGTMFGLVGMLLFVPLFATIYSLFSEIVNVRLKAKNIEAVDLSPEKP